MNTSAIQWTIIIISSLVFIGLAIINPLLGIINMKVRHWVAAGRNMRWRPLLIFTHKYNDIVSLSTQTLVLAMLLAYIWHDMRRAMILMSAMFIQTTAVGISKRISSIARPPQLISHVIMRSSSYPSGHSAASMTFAFLVPIIFQPYIPLPLLIIAGVYLLIVAMLTAYGRLYLDVHWFSDIVGGWLLSLITILLSRMFLL